MVSSRALTMLLALPIGLLVGCSRDSTAPKKTDEEPSAQKEETKKEETFFGRTKQGWIDLLENGKEGADRRYAARTLGERWTGDEECLVKLWWTHE